MFNEVIRDKGHHVALNREYALEFPNDDVFLLIFRRFLSTFLKRTGRTQGQAQAEVNLISHVMGVLSTHPQLVSITGSISCTVQLLDKSPYSDYALQSPPRFEDLQIQALMNKKSSSVFGRIDFFSVLPNHNVSLGASFELDWVLLSPEICKVILVF